MIKWEFEQKKNQWLRYEDNLSEQINDHLAEVANKASENRPEWIDIATDELSIRLLSKFRCLTMILHNIHRLITLL